MNLPRAYIINLDRAPERWRHVKETFATTSLELCRVPAMDGNQLTLPCSNFDARRFRLFHGRRINIYEVACYLSHCQAIEAFLESGESHALIGEDDLVLQPHFESVLEAALASVSSWNILRLTGLIPGKVIPLQKLTSTYSLALHLGRLKGAGAYLLDRKAALAFQKYFLPMWLPWDHALDREWFFGLQAYSVTPFPISQVEQNFPSSIQQHSQAHLSTFRRCLTTYPYQAFNELTRYFFRLRLLIACLVRMSFLDHKAD